MTSDPSSEADGFDFLLEEGTAVGLAARRAVLAGDGVLPDSVREDVLLLVTELVNNAVRHARAGPGRPMRVEVRRRSQLVRVAVVDGGSGFTHEPALCPGDESGGWGLFLVDRIADRWGVRSTSSGTRVWFEIRYGA